MAYSSSAAAPEFFSLPEKQRQVQLAQWFAQHPLDHTGRTVDGSSLGAHWAFNRFGTNPNGQGPGFELFLDNPRNGLPIQRDAEIWQAASKSYRGSSLKTWLSWLLAFAGTRGEAGPKRSTAVELWQGLARASIAVAKSPDRALQALWERDDEVLMGIIRDSNCLPMHVQATLMLPPAQLKLQLSERSLFGYISTTDVVDRLERWMEMASTLPMPQQAVFLFHIGQSLESPGPVLEELTRRVSESSTPQPWAWRLLLLWGAPHRPTAYQKDLFAGQMAKNRFAPSLEHFLTVPADAPGIPAPVGAQAQWECEAAPWTNATIERSLLRRQLELHLQDTTQHQSSRPRL